MVHQLSRKLCRSCSPWLISVSWEMCLGEKINWGKTTKNCARCSMILMGFLWYLDMMVGGKGVCDCWLLLRMLCMIGVRIRGHQSPVVFWHFMRCLKLAMQHLYRSGGDLLFVVGSLCQSKGDQVRWARVPWWSRWSLTWGIPGIQVLRCCCHEVLISPKPLNRN